MKKRRKCRETAQLYQLRQSCRETAQLYQMRQNSREIAQLYQMRKCPTSRMTIVQGCLV